MPRQMPRLADEFARQVDRALLLAEIGERIRAASDTKQAPWSELRPSRLEAFYELAFLRVFIGWEAFLEESFVRYLCGWVATSHSPALVVPAFATIDAARFSILGGHGFVTWADPNRVAARCRQYILAGDNFETVIRSNQSRLAWFASIRHRIAHGSVHARLEFGHATMGFCGRRYPGASAGRFLRDWNLWAGSAERWLQTLGSELKNLAFQIVP